MKIFNDWEAWRNERAVQGSTSDMHLSPIRVELLEMTKDELCFSLTRFVLEAKKQNRDPYPAEILYEIVISIQMYLWMNGRDMKFLNDEEFTVLKNTLDTRMKELTAQGHRVRRRQAEVITEDEEETLCETGVLGDESPQKLLDTILYLFGIHFALRAGSEHRQLRFENSQLSVQMDSEGSRYLLYTEDVSKNRQGGLKHRKLTPKCMRAYENTENSKRCIELYLKYLAHRSSDPKCSSAFYLCPLAKPKSDTWYSCQPLGVNQITGTVPHLCKSIQLTGFGTNHSLRATAAFRLFTKSFDKQLICETTGHRSTAVRAYKRTSDGQKKNISKALYGQERNTTVAQSGPSTVTEKESDGCVMTLNVDIKL